MKTKPRPKNRPRPRPRKRSETAPPLRRRRKPLTWREPDADRPAPVLCPACGASGLPVPGEAVGELELACPGCRRRLRVALGPDGAPGVTVTK